MAQLPVTLRDQLAITIFNCVYYFMKSTNCDDTHMMEAWNTSYRWADMIIATQYPGAK